MKALGIEVPLNYEQVKQLVKHIEDKYPEVYKLIYDKGWENCTTDFHHLRSECCGSCSEGCTQTDKGYLPTNAQHYYGDIICKKDCICSDCDNILTHICPQCNP